MAAAKAVDAGALFRVFTACPNDPRVLILDVSGAMAVDTRAPPDNCG